YAVARVLSRVRALGRPGRGGRAGHLRTGLPPAPGRGGRAGQGLRGVRLRRSRVVPRGACVHRHASLRPGREGDRRAGAGPVPEVRGHQRLGRQALHGGLVPHGPRGLITESPSSGRPRRRDSPGPPRQLPSTEIGSTGARPLCRSDSIPPTANVTIAPSSGYHCHATHTSPITYLSIPTKKALIATATTKAMFASTARARLLTMPSSPPEVMPATPRASTTKLPSSERKIVARAMNARP